MSDQGFPSAQIPAGSVVITPVQMYEEMRKTHEAVERIELKLDPVVERIGDHENRIRVLEKFQWKATGIAVSVATLAGVASGYVTSQIR